MYQYPAFVHVNFPVATEGKHSLPIFQTVFPRNTMHNPDSNTKKPQQTVEDHYKFLSEISDHYVFFSGFPTDT